MLRVAATTKRKVGSVCPSLPVLIQSTKQHTILCPPKMLFSTSAKLNNEVSNNSTTSPTVNPTNTAPVTGAENVASPGPSFEEIRSAAIENFDVGLFNSVADYFKPSRYVEWAITNSHELLDWPWWTTILALTIVARLMLFPLYLYTVKNSVKFANHSQDIIPYQKKMQNPNISQQEKMEVQKEMYDFYKQNGISPTKTFLGPLAQGFVLISVFIGLQNLITYEDTLQFGGMMWFKDLTIADPYLILPIISSCLSSLAFYINQKTQRQGIEDRLGSKLRIFMNILFFALPFLFLFFTYDFPAIIFLYWIGSNLMQVAFALLLAVPKVRTFFKIPAAKRNKSWLDQMKGKLRENAKEQSTLGRLSSSLLKTASSGETKKPVPLYTKRDLEHMKHTKPTVTPSTTPAPSSSSQQSSEKRE